MTTGKRLAAFVAQGARLFSPSPQAALAVMALAAVGAVVVPSAASAVDQSALDAAAKAARMPGPDSTMNTAWTADTMRNYAGALIGSRDAASARSASAPREVRPAAAVRAPVPDLGRDLDDGSRGRSIDLGGERLDLALVNATVAGARAAGVKASGLLAMQSRSAEALTWLRTEDDLAALYDGPYAFTQDTWLAAVRRFGPALGLVDAGAIGAGRDGRPGVSDPAVLRRILNLRGDPYVSSVIAGAVLAADDARYRAVFADGPTLAELMVGHHGGTDMMLAVSRAARGRPGMPLASVVGPSVARDLVGLVGLASFRPDGPRGWSAGGFLAMLDNALKNAVGRYAPVDNAVLPQDYRPGGMGMVQPGMDETAALGRRP